MSGRNEIDATEDTIKSLLSRSYQYVVPRYQRQYSWNEDQWEEFWNDILQLDEENTHFIGSIVLIERNTSIDELDQYEVVDGQQRLTTISILLCAIREYYQANNNSDAAEGINDYLWESDNNFNNRQKLKLNSLDNPQYRRVLHGDSPRNDQSQLRKAVKYFEEKVVSLTFEEINKIRVKLLNAMTLVTIESEDQESAFRLFETLNDRGLELTPVDLMKNYLYKKAEQDPSLNAEAVRRDWETIIEDIRYELDKPYRFFIHYFLYAPEPDITKSVSQNTLYDQFQELVDSKIPESEITLQRYITKMADSSELYLSIVNANVTKFDSVGNEQINSLLSDLSQLGFSQERIYLMGVLSRIDSATEAVRAIQMIESFIIRQRYTGSATGAEINKLYASICSEAYYQDNPIEYIKGRLSNKAPDDAEVSAAIATNNFKKSRRTRFLLKRLERKYYRADSSVPAGGEIEHIVPRKAFTAIKYNEWTTDLQVGREEFDQYKDRIGNLTILENTLNIKAGDNPFDEKKAEYSESDFEMAKSLTNYEQWSIQKIKNRSEQLADAVVRIWDFNI